MASRAATASSRTRADSQRLERKRASRVHRASGCSNRFVAAAPGRACFAPAGDPLAEFIVHSRREGDFPGAGEEMQGACFVEVKDRAGIADDAL